MVSTLDKNELDQHETLIDVYIQAMATVEPEPMEKAAWAVTGRPPALIPTR